ncbi:hypothetical protein ACO2Q3_04030 [Caulobacter sp. KR2-114]|uniref:hypothetical protein n=1 Tax=Caulobacter sp. KR2-114 TaxID=3400912 RepID=UPI003C030215
MAAVVAVTAMWHTAPVWAADLLGKVGFRDAYVAAVRERDPEVTVVAKDEAELEIGLHGKTITAFLDNAYHAYQQNPEDLDRIVRRYATMAVEAVQASEPAYTSAQLVLLVRPNGYGQQVLARAPPGSDPNAVPFARPVAPGLSLYVAVDEPQSFMIPPITELRAKLHATDAEIWASALANTRARLPKALSPTQGMVVVTGLQISPSLMAFDAFWDSPDMQRGGPPLVSPFARDSLVVMHGDGAELIDGLHRAALDAAGLPDALTDAIYVRRGGRWLQVAP